MPWMTQLSTMRFTHRPEARIGPPVDWMVAPLHKIVLLTDRGYSAIEYTVPPFSVTVVPGAARSGARSAANANDAHWLERVAPTDSGRLYADKAYDTKANQAWLRQHGSGNERRWLTRDHIRDEGQMGGGNRRRSAAVRSK